VDNELVKDFSVTEDEDGGLDVALPAAYQ